MRQRTTRRRFMKQTLAGSAALGGLSLIPRTIAATAPDDGYEQALGARRREYLTWIYENFSAIEPQVQPLDGRLWSLNHTRLFLGRDLEAASAYFRTVKLTRDPDFMGIRLLKTLLDFQRSPRLSAEARTHLEGIVRGWPMNPLSRIARWPAHHTENHDLMYLTVGLFSEKLRRQHIGNPLDEVRKSLAMRFDWGFFEWNSHRYQMHYTNPLQVLAVHAPAEDIRQGARDLLDVLFAERALLSVGGYLGGPFQRGYGAERGCDYLDDNRYDSFLPTMWVAFGVGVPRYDFASSELKPAGDGYGNGRDPRLNQDEAVFFATNELKPHPIVRALLAESATRPELVYQGKRASAGFPAVRHPPSDPRTHQMVVFYNTPHISLGSLQYIEGKYPVTFNAPSRFWSVLFPTAPHQVVRTRGAKEQDEKVVPHQSRQQEQRVAQHRNWLVGVGRVCASGGLRPRKAGPWNLYHVGKGLCAHLELGDWQVFQVSDLDKHSSEAAFLDTLSMPEKRGDTVRGRTTQGDRVEVDLRTMAIRINGRLRPPGTEMLHDSEPMRSRFGSGIIRVTTKAGSLRIDNKTLRAALTR